jgi:hypothetical protein
MVVRVIRVIRVIMVIMVIMVIRVIRPIGSYDYDLIGLSEVKSTRHSIFSRPTPTRRPLGLLELLGLLG